MSDSRYGNLKFHNVSQSLKEIQRPRSARPNLPIDKLKVLEKRSKSRSRSAHTKVGKNNQFFENPIEKNVAPKHDNISMKEKSKANLNNSSNLHAKPWGARDPSSQARPVSARLPRSNKDINQQQKISNTKITNILNSLFGFLDKTKMKFTDDEVTQLLDSIKLKLQKYKVSSGNAVTIKKTEELKKPKNVKEMLSLPHFLQSAQETCIRSSPPNISNKSGILEAKTYLLDLASQPVQQSAFGTLGQNVLQSDSPQLLTYVNDKYPQLNPIINSPYDMVKRGSVQLRQESEKMIVYLSSPAPALISSGPEMILATNMFTGKPFSAGKQKKM